MHSGVSFLLGSYRVHCQRDLLPLPRFLHSRRAIFGAYDSPTLKEQPFLLSMPDIWMALVVKDSPQSRFLSGTEAFV